MSKRPVRVLLLVVATAVGCGLTWTWWPVAEPVLRGKSLGAWVEQYYDVRVAGGSGEDALRRKADAQVAIREIGTNALPALLRSVAAHDSEIHQRLNSWIKKIPLLKLDPKTAELRRNRADWGFSVLGPLGHAGIPELTTLLQHPDPGVRGTAARCLGHIGPGAEAAIPAILPLLAERNQGLVILNAMDALQNIHQQPELVVPVMLEFLEGSRTEWNYSVPAMNVLSQYKRQATSAIPALKRYLNHAETDKRNAAYNALNYIDRPLSRTGASDSKPNLEP